jgi:outer membrane receptor protein involved in Fe transport
MKQFILTLIFTITSVLAFAQTTVKGIISDQATGEELIGVNIGLDDKTGTVSDIDGSYEFSLVDGNYTITFSYLGYKSIEKALSINSEESITLDISMEEESEMLVITTVTSSRYERNITKEAISIEVIRPEFIERNVTTDLSQVLERVPGVQIVDGQANIRSGSGFAYGAGSRVAVVVDGQPLLAGEFSDVKWNFIPIENAAQIEIIKGAASVLYGSGGLNGVINVRTAYPTTEPYTKATIYSGMYNIPKKDGRRWYKQDSTGMNPFFTGIFLAHRQKIKNNFDLVLGANIHYDRGYLKTADEQRYRFNINTRYRPPNNDKISMGINANVMRHIKGDFFLWSDGSENAYTHIIDPIDQFKYYSLNIDPYFTAFDKQDNKHSLKFRYFNIGRFTSAGNAPAGVYTGDYQFQKRIEKHDIVMTTGLSYQRIYAKSNLFNNAAADSDSTVINIKRKIDISSAYFQIDKAFFNEKLNLTFGTRIENFNDSNEGKSSTIPVFRGGVNYALSKKDFIRTSFGQGYRIPSLAEKYINDDLTDEIKVLSNPNLKAEFGSSTEIGYKRAIGTKKGNWKGFVDASVFWMDYKDMTEFRFGLYLPDSILANGATIGDTLIAVLNQEGLGFRMINVNRARIAGFEISAFGEGSFGQFPARFWTGYTYSYPGDLIGDPSQKKVGKYIKNLFRSIILKADNPLAQNSILNFRALHVARFDMEMDIHKFTFGLAANYNGYMYDIDDFFKGEGLIEGLVAANSEDVGNIVESLSIFRSNRTKGDLVFDVRTSYNINDKHKVDFVINNIGNRQYALRPLKMSPPMTINVRYGVTLQ